MPPPSPILSIGMPVYNAERYLGEAIDSLLNQTFRDFELIISDNASVDGTSVLCQEYAAKDSRIRYVRQSVNIGALANFDFVLREASGAYFSWAAGDDVWESRWFESLLNRIGGHGCDAVFGQVQQIDEFSQPLHHAANGRLFSFNQRCLLRRIRFFLQFERLGKANLFYSLFKRENISLLHLASYAYDYHALYDYLRIGGICNIPGVFLYKRIHGAGEGNRSDGRSTAAKVLSHIAFPVHAGCLKGYFKYASFFEKWLLALAMPVKYLNAYWHLGMQVLVRPAFDRHHSKFNRQP